MRSISRRIAGSLAFLGMAACAPPAESPAVSLGLTCTDHPAEFSSLSSIHVLAEGRLLAVDPIERRVVIVDFATGEARQTGTAGAGPSEYQTPLLVLSIGDSALLYDPANARYLRFDPAGHPDGSVVLGPEGVRVAGTERMLLPPRTTDAAGRLYFEAPWLSALGDVQSGRGDSVVILRFDRHLGRLDTVARLAGPRDYASAEGPDEARRISVGMASPWAVADAWSVFPDGTILIARPSPYRVAFVAPTGVELVGDSVQYTPLKLSAAHAAEQAAASRALGVRVRYGDAPPREAQDEPADLSFVGLELPPFGAGSAVASARGEAWIQRHSADGLRVPIYDIFDRAGVRIRRVALPIDSRVLRIAAEHLYLARVQPDDLQLVSRCDAPRFDRE